MCKTQLRIIQFLFLILLSPNLNAFVSSLDETDVDVDFSAAGANSLEWSPDENYLAVGGHGDATDADVRIYNWNSSVPSLTITDSQYQGNSVYDINWHPDGNFIASASSYSGAELTIYSWNGSNLGVQDTQSFSTGAYSCQWSPNGNYLAVGGFNNEAIIYTWNGASLTVTDSTYMDDCRAVAWSPDGHYIAFGNTYNRFLKLYEWDGSTLTFKDISTKTSNDITFGINWSPNGRFIAVCDSAPTDKIFVYEWNEFFLSEKASALCSNQPKSARWSSDGKTILVCSYGSPALQTFEWDGGNSTLIEKYSQNNGSSESSDWTSDNIFLAVGALNASQDIKVFYSRPSIDGVTKNVFYTSNTTFNNEEYLQGIVKLNDGFTVPINNILNLDLWVPISGAMSISGQVNLYSDLYLNNDASLTQVGEIDAQGNTIFLGGDLSIPDNSNLLISGDMVIDGQGNNLILGRRSQLLIDATSTLTLRNLILKNTFNTISQPAVKCTNWNATLALDNVELALNDDFSFYSGQMFIHNDVVFTGSSEFIYRGVRPSYITAHSTLNFDKETSFDYSPSCTDETLIKMNDTTSVLYFDGCTLKSTFTGLQLTTGSVYFDNKVNVTTAAALDLKDLISANTTTETDDSSSIAWTPDGKYLAVGNEDQANRLYRLDGETLTLVDSTSETDDTRSIAWTPNGRYLAVGNNNQVDRLYRLDGETLTLVDSTSETDYAEAVAWTPDGRYLAIGNHGFSNSLYRLDGETLTLVDSTTETDDTRSIAWTPNGRYLAVSNSNQADRLYRLDGETLTLVDSTTETDDTRSIAWTPDGKYLAVGNGGQVNRMYRLDGETLTLVDSTSETDGTWSVAWTPDGRYLAVGNYGQANRMYRLDGETLTLVDSTSETDVSRFVAWTPDGRYLAVGNKDQANRLYETIYGPDTQTQASSNSIVFQDLKNNIEPDASMHVLGGAQIILDGIMHL